VQRVRVDHEDIVNYFLDPRQALAPQLSRAQDA
jgi:hypothetical protein